MSNPSLEVLPPIMMVMMAILHLMPIGEELGLEVDLRVYCWMPLIILYYVAFPHEKSSTPKKKKLKICIWDLKLKASIFPLPC
jgi:hypothetical protein